MGISSSVPKNDQSTTTTKKQIFILSGQSNMAGRGGVKNKHWDRIVPDDCKPDPSTIHRLNANLIWETAQEPLHADIDTRKTCGVGPGMSFANGVKDYIVGVIDLVPCAVGGTAIKEWAKGEKLYEDMIRRSKAAANSGGEIKAMIWYQGESDTSSKHVAESYKSNMENLIRNVRSDLGLPSLPIIQVAIASGTDAKLVEVVREAQKAIDLPNVVCVDAKGLELKEDNLHLTTTAQVQLGHMLADAYLAHFG
ncbi:probable carbohydrate esterase At4g34215 [Rutidosis leptorrhynchoides]|uniref:probable carbohydrate esterase At4g34215 n=1 Tax=Rutidosis leptorrhynchoides TaxID=125765 RepID=UPI003A99FE21